MLLKPLLEKYQKQFLQLLFATQLIQIGSEFPAVESELFGWCGYPCILLCSGFPPRIEKVLPGGGGWWAPACYIPHDRLVGLVAVDGIEFKKGELGVLVVVCNQVSAGQTYPFGVYL